MTPLKPIALMQKRGLFFVFGIASLMVGFGWFFSEEALSKESSEEVPFINQTLFGGVVLPSKKATLAFPASGLIAHVPKSGDYFNKGQIVAKIDTAQSQIGVKQASVGLETAELELKSALHDKKKTQRLRKQKIVSDIALTEIGFSVGRARAKVKQAKTQVSAANERLRSCYVRAPFDGMVVDVKLHLGEWASVGSGVLELVNLRKLELRVDLPPDVAVTVDVGQQTDLVIKGKKVGKARARMIVPYIDPASGLVRVVWDVSPEKNDIAGRYVTLAPWRGR